MPIHSPRDLTRTPPARGLLKTFGAQNVTPGTGIAEAIKTSYAATAATLILRNGTGAAASNGLLYRPQYIRLINTVAPASATRSEGLIVTDRGSTRYSSGTTALTTPVTRDGSSSATSSAVIRFGALVTGAASANERKHERFQLKNSIFVAFEEIVIAFDKDAHGPMASASGMKQVVDVGPLIIKPQEEMILHLWHPSNAATPPSWEVQVVWTESRK